MNKTITPKDSFTKQTTEEKEIYIYEPSKNIIDNILSYSKSLSIRDSKTIKKIELILN